MGRRSPTRRAAVALGLVGGAGLWVGLRDAPAPSPEAADPTPPPPPRPAAPTRIVDVTLRPTVPADFAEALALDVAFGALWYFAWTFTPGPAGGAAPGVTVPVPSEGDRVRLRALLGGEPRTLNVPARPGSYLVDLVAGRAVDATSGPRCLVTVA